MAGSSIEINGRPYQKAFLEEEVEAFDGELKVKVTGLQAKVDALLLRVCALRKDVPRQVADLTRRTLSKESDRVMRRLASRPSGVLDPPPASYISRPASSVNPSILEEYQETLKAINRLKKVGLLSWMKQGEGGGGRRRRLTVLYLPLPTHDPSFTSPSHAP